MMKKIRCILICVLVAGAMIGLGLYFAPIRIYLMPIDAWKRPVWSGPGSTQKEENYVVYHHWFKSEQTLIDSVIAFQDRTIRLDSVKKYPDGYCRSFFKRSAVLDKYYREEEDGSDIIFDHADKRILFVEWRIAGDTVCRYFRGENHKFPLADTTALLTIVR